MPERRVPVLYGCGWGLISCALSEVPEECPVCGFNFWEAFGPPTDQVIEDGEPEEEGGE